VCVICVCVQERGVCVWCSLQFDWQVLFVCVCVRVCVYACVCERESVCVFVCVGESVCMRICEKE